MITIPVIKTNMSILEIVLYSIITAFTIGYVIYTIIRIKKGKKNPKKEDETHENE